MEANVAPEKIYFTQTENGTHYYTEGIPFERNYIEYTRTDAFIEKACGFIAENMNRDGNTLRTKATFINEFRNYMKG